MKINKDSKWIFVEKYNSIGGYVTLDGTDQFILFEITDNLMKHFVVNDESVCNR